MAKKAAQIIEQQVQFWMRKEAAQKGVPVSNSKRPIITISREFGAKGAALAEELGRRLEFKVWDKDLLELISKNIGSNKEFIKSLDESRRGLLEDTIFGFIHHRETNLSYLLFLIKAVRALEKFGSNIIVGRGANYICKIPDSFHIRVVCPLNKRIQNYARAYQITKKEASEFILKKDADRQHFSKYNFNQDSGNASDYDLILNSGTFSLSEMAEIAVQAYEMKTGTKVAEMAQQEL
ncbi:MAG: cytidylate kinase-like family protein [Gracilimonas sp.]|uniref:cytidylate kinase-like family protein n=1 Tax=Gracilimonas TaxID=649462 RepID=UPI001B231324|nr:cytidylate kinase-like family protein [Gracilimonas sp.]MBO6584826.1 cytidylate kinase-like family protein [Gracilimonas sp.]MBO6615903.1 cytidylate kinase-like family protein [Gracilimonas sp.]